MTWRLPLMTLTDWINQHDCGVSPTGIDLPDGSIEIRVLATAPGCPDTIESTIVRTYQEARDALGY